MNTTSVRSYGEELFVHDPDLIAQLPSGHPHGEFMIPLPLDRDHVRPVPHCGGGYFIYVRDTPFYAGMSRVSLKKRLWAHATGRGSAAVRMMLEAGEPLFFEYCPVDSGKGTTHRDVARAEFCFMLMLTGAPLPGNLKLDGMRLFPDPTIPKAPSLLALLADLGLPTPVTVDAPRDSPAVALGNASAGGRQRHR